MQLRLKNFLAFAGDQTLVIPDQGIFLVKGHNMDEATANGACKSGLFSAICYGLFGKTPRDVTRKELSFRDEGSMSVELSYKNVKSRIGDTVVFNGEEMGKALFSEKIEEKLGFTYDQFLKVCYIYQDSKRFLDLNDTEKKDFLFPLMKWEVIYDAISNISGNINICSSFLETDQGLQDFKKQSEDLSIRAGLVDKQYQDVQRILSARIDKAKPEYDRANDAFEVRRRETRETLNEFKGRDREILETINSIKCQIQNEQSKVKERDSLNRQVIELRLSIRNSETAISNRSCSECKQQLHDEHSESMKLSISSNYQKIENLLLLLKELPSVDLKAELHEKIAGLEVERNKILTDASRLNNELRMLQSESEAKKRDLDSAQKELSFKKDEFSQHLQYIQKDIRVIDQKIQDNIKKREDTEIKKKDLEETKEVLRLLQSSAIDHVMEALNVKINEYLSPMTNGGFGLEFSTSKVQGNKKVVQKINAVVTHKTRGEISLGSLSGGEYASCRLAVDLALHELVLEHIPQIFPILILDEATHNIAAQGKSAFYELLSTKLNDRLILIVDHHEELQGMFRNITVQKQNERAQVFL